MENTFELHSTIIEKYPQLTDCKSATEASKIVFGIKGLTNIIERVSDIESTKLKEFFGENHSDFVVWANNVKQERYGWAYFYALPQHEKTYRKMVKEIGIEITVRLTQDRDFSDIAIGYEFLKSDKKRFDSFKKNILDNLKLFPTNAHSKMIHDYIIDRMKAEERKAKPKMEAPVTLPLPSKLPEVVDDFNILIPRNERDLKRIGNAQGHCVGTQGMGYASKIRRGDVWIFAMYRKGLSDGVCVEVSKDGTILQVQGKHRRSPDVKERGVISKLVNELVA